MLSSKSAAVLHQPPSQFKRKIIFGILNVTCFGMIFCGTFQLFDLYTYCGKEFRPSPIVDALIEDTALSMGQVLLGIAGVFGIWTKRGSMFFIFYAILISTLVAFHACDVTLIFIDFLRRGHAEQESRKFLKRMYKHYDTIWIKWKVDRLHHCMPCCGIQGPKDKAVELSNGTLIPSCCPTDVTPCTVELAYQTGCLSATLLTNSHPIMMYQVKNVLNFIFEIFTYKIVLWAYV